MSKPYTIPFLSFFVVLLFAQPLMAQPLAEVNIRFVHKAGGLPMVLQDSGYKNVFGEAYQLTRLKYYVSNTRFAGVKQTAHQSVHLVDAAGDNGFSILVKPGVARQLIFKLGVDSLYNCSGAQDGELDPLKGMFWSWNSGYIFFKLEGYSASSTADLQRIEHHIGGYLGAHDASRMVKLDLPAPLQLKAGNKYFLEVTLNLDKYWKGKNDITIASNALIMTPGALAIKSADNFAGMFSITKVE